MKPKILCNELSVAPDLPLYYTGPALDHGPLPSVFYFALSGPDSLTLDPYNQPVHFLRDQMVRVFSLTLPGHENNLPPSKALELWAQDLPCIDRFLDDAQKAIEFCFHQRLIDPAKFGLMGLSRGGFIATHLAARESRSKFLLLFAPVTSLRLTKEFAHLPVEHLDLEKIAPQVSDRHIRLYIGNEDTRVGTRSCFDFAMACVEKKKTRASAVEMIVSQSIGHMGHGTSPEIFKQGADWMASCLNTPIG